VLADKLSKIEYQIQLSLLKSGRKDQVSLIAVSKKQDVRKMLQYELLKKDKPELVIFGENYVQEFKDKKINLSPESKCHLIGKLQSNKVKEAVRLFDVIQSIDSEKLLILINKEASNLGKIQEIMLQVNVSNDPKKGGMNANEVFNILAEIEELKHLKLVGLMTITELYENPQDSRKDFKNMKKIKDALDDRYQNLELSMGMSQDFEIAIEEGATMVRIGTALFGER